VPLDADLVIDTQSLSLEESVKQVLDCCASVARFKR
jgi:adenylylsulfate kinase-like enzyme